MSGGRWREREAVGAGRAGGAGFTLIELLLAIITVAVLLGVAYGGYRQFNEAVVVKKAANIIGSDVALTRSLAIQRRSNVSLVADEPQRSYVIRDTAGAVLARRSFDRTAALPLDMLDVQADGDSVAFNSRGLMASGAGVVIELGRGERRRAVTVNALGRYQVSDRL